uniref:fimbrial protein n=1 Tax=Enterobacter kobei TaxID=208224 RepID=UPI00358DC958
MKGNTLKSIVVLSSLFFGAQTHAANGNGTVHFTGEIIDSTCEVSTGTKDQTVDLGRVRISTLRNENETFSQLNSITYIGVFLRLVTYSHLP